MPRSHRKKKTPIFNPLNEQGDIKDKVEPSVAPPPITKHVAFKRNDPTVTVAPKDQVGLLVTTELEKAMEECRTKVAQIVKGCRATNRRFRDVEFDLENDNIRCQKGLTGDYDDQSGEDPPAVLRLTQIFEKPQFVIDGAEAIDIIQGRLGDCWLLSALSTMSTSKGLIEKLCIARDEEVGVYGFVFFRGSTWVSVIIDDQFFWSLPKYEELDAREKELYRGDKEAYNNLSRRGGKGLYFARSGTEGETWVPLIEKAYAKLHGDYQSLEGGWASEAIEDLTGGVSVMYFSKDILDLDRFWKEELLQATKDRLFGCSFADLDTRRQTEIRETPKVHGLLGAHAYSVLRVKECKGKRFLVIRNPWGASEWTGAWGDGSKEWVGEWLDVLKDLDHVFGDDGEFVMEYSDFLDTFEVIERTTIFDSNWVMSSHWLRIPPQRPNHPWTFSDLSFKFTLSEPSFTIISLSQLDTRYFEQISGYSIWNIDFVIYKCGDKEITGVSYHAVSQMRSVTSELDLEAGEYIIFPRCDRSYSIPPQEYRNFRRAAYDQRTLTRVLTERAKARSIADNYDGADNIYFPTTIDELIEKDLEKLEQDSVKKKLVNDVALGREDEGDDKPEKAEDAKAEADDALNAEDETARPVEGIPEVGNLGMFSMPGYYDPSIFPYAYGMSRADDDDDGLILGVRIYTRGGAVVSVTGQVVGEEIYEDDDAKATAKETKEEKRQDNKEDTQDKKEDTQDKKER